MSHPSSITDAVLEKILAFLAPLFVIVGTTDITAAREIARATLASHGARTDRELRFAALSIAFSFGALEALSKAADLNLPTNQMLRLCGSANALNRAAHQNEARLEKSLKQSPAATKAARATDATPEAPIAALPASTATEDLLVFARSRLKGMMNNVTPAVSAPMTAAPVSRQQRRAAERKAEKVRQRQQEEARLAQRAATLRQPAMQSA